MNTSDYPGKDLSLSQLAYALNEQLKRTANPPLFTLDAVSQLERDISTALAAVHEWKNSFARINRIPIDILCLIPTHLSSQKDRFVSTFVCRHWRRIFLQHGALWSQLLLVEDEDYVATMLERAKGSALDVVAACGLSPATMTLLSPHARQIRHLEFPLTDWTLITTFSDVNSGPLPLLRILRMCVTVNPLQPGQPSVLATPSLPILSGATNLEEFAFHLREGTAWGLSPNRFIFPNLTTFTLVVATTPGLNASDLLGFLGASPMLRTVEMEINGWATPWDVPQDALIVLPNIEIISMIGKIDDRDIYHLAIHISCPNAKFTMLVQEICDYDLFPDLKIFPDPTSWQKIVRQYTPNPVEHARLDIQPGQDAAYFLTFQSSNRAAITFGFRVSDSGMEEEELDLTQTEMDLEAFSQAFRTIRDHPLLPHLRNLCIQDWTHTFGADSVLPMADVVGELFVRLGSLDGLIISGFDLRVFLAPFIDLPELRHLARVFPHVKKLTIGEGQIADRQRSTDAIVELAKSQSEQGKPFDCIAVNPNGIPAGTAERLRQWVNVVDCG